MAIRPIPGRKTALALLCVLALPLAAPAQTSPESFLGHRPGEDRKLADYAQIQAYFQKLDEESGRLRLLTIGTSTLGKPMIMAAITAEENMGKLDAYRKIAYQLKEARGLTPGQAAELAREGKVILLITNNIHASEIASSQTAMELAYDLVTGRTPFDADKVLKDVIVLIVPTTNPDGQQMVADWYRKYVGTKFEGGGMPWLYHHYAGHDNNRDWFMLSLKESRAVTKVLYHDWFPQIHLDEHQMGSSEARLFIPPFMNPPVPNVLPLLWRSIHLCGANMAYDLQKSGFSGVEHGRSFTGWWIGACDDTSWLHNVVGLLSEMASVKIATPVFIEPTEVRKSYAEKHMEFPDPWPGGWWRLRDLVDYELVLSFSLIKTAYLHKQDFLLNSYRMSKTCIETRDKGQPFAFVISARQHDYPTALKMLEVLRLGGVEIHRAKADFTADGKAYPAGSFVILLAQPYKPYVWALLEKQKYPDLRQYPGGPPIPPYDNAGWTLPLQMGVFCDPIDGDFDADLEEIDHVPHPAVKCPSGNPGYFVLDSSANSSYALAFALLRDEAQVFRSKTKIRGAEFEAAAGSFIVKNTPAVEKTLTALAEKWDAAVYGLEDAASLPKSVLKNPRIALYRSWKGSTDEGWTRLVFDDLGIPYESIRNKDFKGVKGKTARLKASFDVIVFADENPDIIKTGRPPANSGYSRRVAPLPPEYEGGIEADGIDALRLFVEEGGILVALNRACGLVLREFDIPARNAIENVERDKFFCPTSLLKLAVDNTTPLGYGLPSVTPAVFSDSPAFDTWIPQPEWDRKVVASYPEDGLLLSGWLLGEDAIARKAAVVDTSFKKGRIVLIGVRAQHRAQAHGTYKFLLNALLYPESEAR